MSDYSLVGLWRLVVGGIVVQTQRRHCMQLALDEVLCPLPVVDVFVLTIARRLNNTIYVLLLPLVLEKKPIFDIIATVFIGRDHKGEINGFLNIELPMRYF